MFWQSVKEIEEQNRAYNQIVSALGDRLRLNSVCRENGIHNTDDIFEAMKNDFSIVHLNKELRYCPFGSVCKHFSTCEELDCRADELDNGVPR